MSWTNTPAGTQSFVLHMHDLDVARNKTTDRASARRVRFVWRIGDM